MTSDSAPPASNLDDEARAELLTYMVTSQLVAHATTGTWLPVEQQLESAKVWCESNGAHCGADERTRIGCISEELAREFVKVPRMRDLASLRELFTGGWRLDYRSAIVGAMYDVCRERLI